jgi:hypothetical protein
MATRTLVDRPFQDLSVPELLDTRTDSEVVATVCIPARGVFFGLAICTPFWLAVFWLLL